MRPEDFRLRTDFTDPYDHHFGVRHRELPWIDRMGVTARTRQGDHELLRRHGFKTPTTGRLQDFLLTLVVAYVDPTQHQGRGKVHGTAKELLDRGMDPLTYCSVWIPSLGPDTATSTRVALIGGRVCCWSYEQQDPEQWRSNVGDVEIRSIEASPYMEEVTALWRLGRELRTPLLAVDLVAGVAVDLNTAPGLHDCPGLPGWREVAEDIATRAGELRGIGPG